jgi:lactate permease
MPWTQAYTPAHNLALSALLAALPVAVLLGLLAFSRAPAHVAALAGLAASLGVAIFVYGMPAKLAGMAAVSGAAYGLFPIGWIVLGAIFVYDITCHTGQFEVVKRSVAGVADDRRIQAILIAFCFGAFIEGAAGFGTPVAISAAMLIGLGFKPLPAAGLALLGNTAPVAFGALGTPIIALAQVTGIPETKLAMMVGRQLPIFSLIVPLWLVWAMAGRKRAMEVWPAWLTAGLSFAIVQFLISNFHGPWLAAVGAALASILCMLILLRFWQPPSVWRFEHDEDADASRAEHSPPLPRGEGWGEGQSCGTAAPGCVPPQGGSSSTDTLRPSVEHSRGQLCHTDRPSPQPSPEGRVGKEALALERESSSAVIAWMPWMIVSVLVFVWGIPPVKAFLNRHAAVNVAVPVLDQRVYRVPPVVAAPRPEPAVFVFNWLSATGTSLLLAGILSGFLLGLGPIQLAMLFAKTLWRLKTSLLTISAMMAIGYTTRYGGLDATMGLAFAGTGRLFPFFSPLLGWLGVALTGSDTSSNVLFGNLQQITANRLNFSPLLAAASNSSGGVMGKMIDAQSIVVAGVATGRKGGEGEILRYVFFHSIALAILVGLLVLLQAYVLKSWIP